MLPQVLEGEDGIIGFVFTWKVESYILGGAKFGDGQRSVFGILQFLYFNKFATTTIITTGVTFESIVQHVGFLLLCNNFIGDETVFFSRTKYLACSC